MLVDEGGKYPRRIYAMRLIPIHVAGYSIGEEGVAIATPAVAEKGKLDVRMKISTPGGHSSVPPQHTVSCSMSLPSYTD